MALGMGPKYLIYATHFCEMCQPKNLCACDNLARLPMRVRDCGRFWRSHRFFRPPGAWAGGQGQPGPPGPLLLCRGVQPMHGAGTSRSGRAALPMECLTSHSGWHAPPRGLGCRRAGIPPWRRPPPGPAPEVLMGQTRAGPALVVRTDDSRRGLRPLRPQATKSRSGLTSQPERHSSWY